MLRSCQITGALKVHVIGEESQDPWLRHWNGWQHRFHPPATWGKRSLFVLSCGETLAERKKLELLCCSRLSSLSKKGTWVGMQPCTLVLPLPCLWNSCAFLPLVLNKNKVQNGLEKAAARELNSEPLQASFSSPSYCWEPYWGNREYRALKGSTSHI